MIETRALVKRYRDRQALAGLDLKVEEGEVFGFIGPNGAGKTTTIKILATLLRPSAGQAFVAGLSVATKVKEIRRVMGYMPDFFGLYEDLTVREYLEFFAAAYRIRGSARKKVVDEVLALVDLTHRADTAVENLSRGMQQRLSLARVLLHDPKVLLLDEPASGLDPRARVEIREIIKELRKMGKTILISSHILPELADMCSRVGIIEAGRLVFSGTIEEASAAAQMDRWVRVGVSGDEIDAMHDAQAAGLIAGAEGNAGNVEEMARAREIVERVPGVLTVEQANGFLRAQLGPEADAAAIPAALIEQGLRVVHYAQEVSDLEDAFLRLTKGQVT